jgi:hypothetical protein
MSFESDGAYSFAAQHAVRRSRAGMRGHCPQIRSSFHTFLLSLSLERSFGSPLTALARLWVRIFYIALARFAMGKGF